MQRWLPLPVRLFLLCLVGWVNRRQGQAIDYLLAENRVLREALGGRRPRLTDDQRRLLARKGRPLGKQLLAEVATLVTPETILRWYRELVARKYDGGRHGHPGPGRPRTRAQLAELVVRLALENPLFGYTRIVQALANLQLTVSRSTVAAILKERGIEPAPERSRRTSWKEFLAAHWDGLAAADFFSVEVLTWTGLVRYQALFVKRLATRRVQVAGIVRDTDANGEWMLQVARNLTDAVDGFLQGVTHLILDRDPLFTKPFRQLLHASGVRIVRLPKESPNLNAFAERWVRSVRSEALRRVVPLGEWHLRRVLSAYLLHYHRERPHQGLGGALIDPDETAGRAAGRIRCRERLGGYLRYYYREAEAA